MNSIEPIIRNDSMLAVGKAHDRRATELALDLFAICQAQVVDEMKHPFQQQVIRYLGDFAFNARRACRAFGIFNDRKGMNPLHLFEGGQIAELTVERDFFYSLNRIMHAVEIRVVYVIDPRTSIFDKQAEVLSYIDVRTDEYETAHVSLFGITTHYLTKIRKQIEASIQP